MPFDSVQIGVEDLAAAARAYALLLGVEPQRVGAARRFQLARGAVELEARGEPGLHAISLGPDDASAVWPVSPAEFHGLDVRIVSPSMRDAPPAIPDEEIEAIDHVVVHSSDLERAIALWRDRLGVRLALDRSFPERGLRMLFFRSGGVTLEFVGTLDRSPDPNGPDRLYGVAYRVGNLAVCRARLLGAGVDVSEIRPGHKPGTTVATVRSHTAKVPTLLLAMRAMR